MMSTQADRLAAPDLGDTMSRSSLVRHQYAHAPKTILGYRKSGAPIFPIAGAEDDPPKADDSPKQDDPPKDQTPGEEAVDEQGNKLGFPAKTPVAEMNDKQAAAYWRNQAKTQQKRADGVKDYDQVKADADKWRAHAAEQQTPSEKALEAAKLEAKKEVAGDSAIASLRAILTSRGKDENDLNDLLEFVSPDRFVTTDGKVDHQKVTAYADKLAPTGSQESGGGFGQGRYEQTQQSRSAAGKAEAERRFGKRQ